MTGIFKAQSAKREKTPISWGYHMELYGGVNNMSAIISEVVGILEITENLIKVMTRSGNISVSGTSLNIHIFEYKALQITGKIENISFSKKEKNTRRRSYEHR